VRETAEDLCFDTTKEYKNDCKGLLKMAALKGISIERVTVVGDACGHYRSEQKHLQILREIRTKKAFPNLHVEFSDDDS